jgi:hypothetical protein
MQGGGPGALVVDGACAGGTASGGGDGAANPLVQHRWQTTQQRPREAASCADTAKRLRLSHSLLATNTPLDTVSSGPLLLVPQPGRDHGTSAAQPLHLQLGQPANGAQLRGSAGRSGSGSGTREAAVAAAQQTSGSDPTPADLQLISSSDPFAGQTTDAGPPQPMPAGAAMLLADGGVEPSPRQPGSPGRDGGGEPSSRLGTLKRDRSPSPSNGVCLGPAGGVVAAAGARGATPPALAATLQWLQHFRTPAFQQPLPSLPPFSSTLLFLLLFPHVLLAGLPPSSPQAPCEAPAAAASHRPAAAARRSGGGYAPRVHRLLQPPPTAQAASLRCPLSARRSRHRGRVRRRA